MLLGLHASACWSDDDVGALFWVSMLTIEMLAIFISFSMLAIFISDFWDKRLLTLLVYFVSNDFSC